MTPEFPGFRILGQIGSGSHGTVYKAEDLILSKTVALKVLRPASAGEGRERARRFLSEFRALARLDHPNLVTAYRIGFRDGVYLLAMEFVDGESLKARLEREGTLSPGAVISIGRDIAAALLHMEEQGFVHRDIKPANVLLAAGGVAKLADLGLGRLAATSRPRITVKGKIVGTPRYMAPEQIASPDLVDIRTDLYSLGATLYHALAGRPPFQARSVRTLVDQIFYLPPPRIDESPAGLPESLWPLLESLLAKDMADRPNSSRIVLARLSTLLETLAPLADAETEPTSSFDLEARTSPSLETDIREARRLRDAGRLEEALQKIERVRSRDPDHPEIANWDDLLDTL